METENKTAETKPAATTPAVDVDAIVAKATEAAIEKATALANSKAEELVNTRLKRASRELSGEPEVDQDVEVLRQFAGNPRQFFQGLAQHSAQQAQEIATRTVAQQQLSAEFQREYPELTQASKAKFVDALAKDKMSSGVPYKEALKASYEETVKEFGLKSVSEQQAASNHSHGLLGGFGGRGGAGSSKKEQTDSAKAFLEARKKQMKAFKGK